MTDLRTWMFERFTRCILLGGMGLFCLPGCATRGEVELLEANLRHRENQLHSHEQELSRLRDQLTISRREADILRRRLAGSGDQLAEEATHKLAAVEGLRFNTFLTAGQDEDGIPGDERLHVMLYPHDTQGEVVKLAGELELEAIDPSAPEDQRSLGRWTYSAEESRDLWHAGFLSSGYQIDVPWKRPPQGERVVLHARLKVADDRRFEATHTVTVAPVRSSSPERTAQADTDSADDEDIAPSSPDEEATHPGETEWQDRPVPRPIPLAESLQEVPPGETENDREFALPQRVDADTGERSTREDSRTETGNETDFSNDSARDHPAARPFPDGLRTSDLWTDESIPAWR
jgi:hypothetical protein